MNHYRNIRVLVFLKIQHNILSLSKFLDMPLSRASMGPRLFGRGKCGGAGAGGGSVAASMGPRLFGRGKMARLGGGVTLTVASMGPRLFGRGKLVGYRRSTRRLLASMGPRLFGRGKADVDCGRCRDGRTLQWGRDCLVAESSRGAGTWTFTRVCFNGAATVWSRKERN